MKVTFAVVNKHGDNAVTGILDLLHSFGANQASNFGLVLPKKSYFEKSLNILSRKGLVSSSLLGCVSSQPILSNGYDFLQLEDTAVALEGSIYAPIPKAALTEQVAKYPQYCETALQTLLEQADGDFAFWMLRDGWIAAGRDPIGVQPLYYGENNDVAAFATNRKALWRLGIENPASFPPGNMAFVDRYGFKFKPVKTLSYYIPKAIMLEKAAEVLQVLLVESIQRRLHGLKEVSVAFSGGLDSSIVAFLANKQGVKVNLFHVSLERQSETEEAFKAADDLDLPIQVHLFKDSDVEKALPKVLDLIEEPNPVKASIGVPFYWVAERAAGEGFKVMLTGQGADELFGGYQRYVNECLKEGSTIVGRTMFNDIVNIHINNLERDSKITDFFDMDLRLPFASYQVAEFALGLPIECKIESKPDTLRKLVLRKVAENIGMPPSISAKPKKAVQYSTGINDAVRRIAKKQGKSINEYIGGLFEEMKSSL